jgi:hypothetical protein
MSDLVIDLQIIREEREGSEFLQYQNLMASISNLVSWFTRFKLSFLPPLVPW